MKHVCIASTSKIQHHHRVLHINDESKRNPIYWKTRKLASPQISSHQRSKQMTSERYKEVLSFKIMGHGNIINFVKSYFDIPDNMVQELEEDLKQTQRDDTNQYN
jgi:hypothetical protein